MIAGNAFPTVLSRTPDGSGMERRAADLPPASRSSRRHDPGRRAAGRRSAAVGAPLRTGWNVLPKTGEEWKPVADAGAAATIKNIPGAHLLFCLDEKQPFGD